MFIKTKDIEMKNLNLVYALKDNIIVHISEVESGLRCGCKCPACIETLIARKGNKVLHHFAHKSTIECEFGYQTSLHLAAKRVISETGIIQDVYKRQDKYQRTFTEKKRTTSSWSSCNIEGNEWCKSY